MEQTATAPDGTALSILANDSQCPGASWLYEDDHRIEPPGKPLGTPWPTMAAARAEAEARYLARQRVKFPDYLPGDYYFAITWRTE